MINFIFSTFGQCCSDLPLDFSVLFGGSRFLQQSVDKNKCVFFLVGAREQVVAYTEKSQVKHENRHIQLVREYGFHPRTKASVSDGAVLPR